MKRIAPGLVAAALCLTVQAALADVVAIVAAQSPITSLTSAQISDVFLGKLTRLADGTRPLPIDQTEGSATRDAFYLQIAGKSPAQMKAFWSKLIFTGRGRPPKAVADDLAVLKSVQENPVAIGYLDRRSVNASVRIQP
ncbi:MAG: phosphate ABC transporter substrate-binding protein [Steroidobacteraceae bacterium]